MKPTLVILAAGIGSRFGGLKQIERIGPNGEIIIDYSIYDALLAGFGKIVIVIRKEIERDFEIVVSSRFKDNFDATYAYQEIEDVPQWFAAPSGRSKPWGTGHAILVSRDHVHEPFAVINADDFYGRRSFAVLADYLKTLSPDSTRYCMVAFRLGNTLSEYGHVARGVCDVAPDGMLRSVVERTYIVPTPGGPSCTMENGETLRFTGEELVSMNLWGFTPTIFAELQSQFDCFLRKHGSDPKKEFFIPTVVDEIVRSRLATVRVLHTPERWFGVTYREDIPPMVEGIRALIKAGLYPQRLWK